MFIEGVTGEVIWCDGRVCGEDVAAGRCRCRWVSKGVGVEGHFSGIDGRCMMGRVTVVLRVGERVSGHGGSIKYNDALTTVEQRGVKEGKGGGGGGLGVSLFNSSRRRGRFEAD